MRTDSLQKKFTRLDKKSHPDSTESSTRTACSSLEPAHWQGGALCIFQRDAARGGSGTSQCIKEHEDRTSRHNDNTGEKNQIIKLKICNRYIIRIRQYQVKYFFIHLIN